MSSQSVHSREIAVNWTAAYEQTLTTANTLNIRKMNLKDFCWIYIYLSDVPVFPHFTIGITFVTGNHVSLMKYIYRQMSNQLMGECCYRLQMLDCRKNSNCTLDILFLLLVFFFFWQIISAWNQGLHTHVDFNDSFKVERRLDCSFKALFICKKGKR